MIGRKDEDGFIVPIKLRDEAFSSIHDVVDHFDVFHIFLTGGERQGEPSRSKPAMGALTRECGRCE